MLRTKEKPSKIDLEHAEDPHWPRDLETRLKRLGSTSFEVKIVLGSTQLALEEIDKLKEGSIVETRKLSGQPAEIMVNGTLFGHGELIVIGDELALRINNLVKP